MSDIKLTQRLKMHLNGGSKFSSLVYMIYADGRDTGITRTTKTKGRPHYLIAEDTLSFGEETFDIMQTKGVGMKEWILERVNGETNASDRNSRS